MLFLMFTHDNAKNQKHLLGALEKLLELKKDLISKVPLILKALYDSDIVDEEVFLEWGKKASKKYASKETAVAIQAKAEPFLKWLKEADEESESEDDDGLEIEYDDKARPQALKDQQKPTQPAVAVAQVNGAAQEDENDSDVDIDNLWSLYYVIFGFKR